MNNNKLRDIYYNKFKARKVNESFEQFIVRQDRTCREYKESADFWQLVVHS